MTIGDGIAFGCCIMGVTYLAGLLARFTHENQRERRQRMMVVEELERIQAVHTPPVPPSHPSPVIGIGSRRGGN